jgi:hypothetical protein
MPDNWHSPYLHKRLWHRLPRTDQTGSTATAEDQDGRLGALGHEFILAAERRERAEVAVTLLG